MLVHLRAKHPEAAPEKRPHRLADILELKCCGRTFPNGRALHRHRANTHFQRYNGGAEEPPSKRPALSYTCSICGNGYPTRLTMLRHEMEDHEAPGSSNALAPDADDEEANYNTAGNSTARDQEQEEEEEEDPYSDVDDHEPLSEDDDDGAWDDPKRLFRHIGAPVVDTAGQKNFKASRYRWSFGLTKKAITLCEEGFSMEVLRAVIKELFKKISTKKGRIQIKLMSDYLDYPIVMPLFKISAFDPLVLLNYIESVLSSKDRLAIDQPLTIDVIHIGEMEGGGVRLNPMTVSGYLRRHNGCWDPTNVGEDYRCLTFCLAASILIGKRGKNFKKAKFYKDPFTSRDLAQVCKEISVKADVNMAEKCGRTELDKYQRVFNNYYNRQIVVHDWENNLGKLYAGQPSRGRKQQINLLYHREHYSLIWDMESFVGRTKRYCEHCIKVYDSRREHGCESACPRCLRKECQALNPENCNTSIRCEHCDIIFRNFHCYLAHKGSQQVCLKLRRLCVSCLKVVKGSLDEHMCRKGPKCIHCHEEVFHCHEEADPVEHLCQVQIPTQRTCLGAEEYNVVYFDAETSTNPDGRLIPYLICCAVNCEKCIDSNVDRCDICGQRYRAWYGWQCVNEFGNWLSTTDRFEKQRTILTTHNSAKFDGYFIYKYAAERGQKPKLHFKSNDLLSLTWKKVQMKDSLQFLKCSLDKLPTILGFEGAKGFYAWRLVNRCPTLDYRGKIPPPYDFGIERMTDDKRVQFFEWYNELKENPEFVYDLREEALNYCRMDVKILESAWKLFRKSSLKLTDGCLDPLIGRYFTLAGFSAAIYKALFMTTEIGIIPWGGYRNPKRVGQSLLRCAYLDYLNGEREANGETPLICTNNSPREISIWGYKVDGFDEANGDVYEILGCYWHGHCFTPRDCNWRMRNTIHPTRKPMTYADVNRETNNRLYLLGKGGRKVIKIWECEIEKLKRADPHLAEYFKREDVLRKYHKPLDPADAVYGGRVEAFKMRVTLTEDQIKAGWTIEYIDFCSLYPYVQWAFEYATASHPEVVTDRVRLDALTEDGLRD